MNREFAFKAWVYLLCVSFLLLTSGLHTMVAEAEEVGRPLGEMVSIGEVKFESKKMVWKNVELSQFPIFSGMRIKTGKGASLITLEGHRQIDVRNNSLLSFDRSDQVQLTEGTIDFRLPWTAELSFEVADLTVIQSKSFQASKKPLPISPKSEVTIGSILVHSNGAVTVKCLQGSLSVLNRGRVVLASLSSKDTVIFPSDPVKAPQKVMVAQTGKKSSASDPESSKFLGISTWVWIAIGCAVVAATSITVAQVAEGGGGGGAAAPVCP